MLYYVGVLDGIRARCASLPIADLLSAFEDVAPRIVREDFAAMAVPLRGDVDVHAAYWCAVQGRAAAEEELLTSSEVRLQFPTEEELRAAWSARRARAASRDNMPASAAARLADLAFDAANENAELFVLGHGSMVPGMVAYRYQLATARQVLEDMNGVAIVADEVGLGKTIVAGLILKELLAHEPRATALILVPPNLREQWGKWELPTFFDLRLAWDPGKEVMRVAARHQIVLLSLDQAKGTEKSNALPNILLRRKWDLLIVDEAHDCRNLDRLRFKFVYSLRARRRVFLTATPIHNSGYDIFHLANLLKPGCLGPRSNFSENYMEGERVLKDSAALSARLAPMLTRTLRRQTGIRFAKRKLTAVRIVSFKTEEHELYNELLVLLRGIYRRHMGGAAEVMRYNGRPAHVSQFVLISMLVLREMASHPTAAIETLKTALRARVEEFARITYDDSDLAKLDDFIARYASRKWDAAHHAKSERLLRETAKLAKDGAKFIVYVNYLKSLQILVKMLAKQHPDLRVLSYEGGLGRTEKGEVIEALNDEKTRSCLVSTDAGGQGLNLQAANCVINYDFPWNPMRVEQRIGRVDRAKQKSPVIRVLNFRTLGTVEEYVQIVLTSKLKECRSVLGDFESPLTVEKVYEDKLTMGIGSALMESTDADDMRRRMSRLGEDDLNDYVGDYADYEDQTPPEWTSRPGD
jgi:SNF2 family DNA or RNA helicase